MSLAPYRRLLAVPSVRHLLLFGILARLPHTAAGVVLTLHVVNGLGRGWAAAGLVGAATTVGMAIGGPWRGRMVDRMGLRRALAPSIVVEALVWGTAPFLSYEWLLVAAVVGGLMSLPIFTVVRQSLSVLVPVERRRTAYAADSMGVELSFMTGPAVGVAVATSVSTTAALLMVGATTVLAGLGMTWFNPPTRSEQLGGRRVDAGVDRAEAVSGLAPVAAADAGRGAIEGALAAVPAPPGSEATQPWSRSPALLAVLLATAGAAVVLAGTDVGVIATLKHAGAVQLTGLVFAFWGLGSILGALVYGSARRGVHPLWLLLALGVLTVPIGFAHTPWLLCLAILPAGALCAPTISATAEAVARLVPESSRGVAMGWHGSALTIGSALGAPAAGAAIDALLPAAGFAVVGVIGAVLAVLGLVVQRARRLGALAVVSSPGVSSPGR